MQEVLGGRALRRWNHWELVWHLRKSKVIRAIIMPLCGILSFPLISHINSRAF